MHTSHRRIAAITVAAIVGAAALPAVAASSSSIYVTSFSVTTSTGLLTWSDPYQSFSASALEAGGLLGAGNDDFATADYAFAAVGTSTTSSLASVSSFVPQTFYATADTADLAGAQTNLPNQAQAIAGQSGSFTVTDASTVTFDVGYMLDASSPGGNAIDNHAVATLAFDVSNSDGSRGGSLGETVQSFAATSGMVSRSGTFSMTVQMMAGEMGFYNLQGTALAFSPAAVPEPAEWMLLAGGLFGIAVRARRRIAAQTV